MTTRRRARLIAGVALALALALWLMPIPLPRGRALDPLVARLAEQSGADVTVSGATVRLLPRPCLRLGAGSVVRTGSPAGAGADSALAVAAFQGRWHRMELTLAVLPLAQGRVVAAGAKVRGADLVVGSGVGEGPDGPRGPHWRIDGASLALRGLSLDLSTLQRTQPMDLLADAAGKFTLSADSLGIGKALLRNLAAHGKAEGRLLLVEDYSADCGGGRIQGQGTVDFTADPRGRLTMEAELTGVPAADLLREWVPDLSAQLDLNLDGKIQGALALGDAVTAVRTLQVAGTLGGTTGIVHARPWLTDMAPYLGQRQDLQDVRTEAWTLAFDLAELRCRTTLDLRGPDTNWQGQGWLGLDGTMDLGLRVALPPGYTPELGQWAFLAEMLRDDQQRVNLGFRLSGPYEDLQFGLDLAGMLTGGGR